MKQISRTFQVKEGKNYKTTFIEEDANKVYKDLAQELIQMKLFRSPVYTRLTDSNNYDGTRTIMIYQKHGNTVGRDVFIIETH